MVQPSLMFEVLGRPAPQGSKRAFRAGNNVRLVEASKRVQPYRQAIAAAALEALSDLPLEQRDVLREAPVIVTLTFWLARPAGHHRTGRHFPALRPGAPARPAVAPDVDKLARAAIDGIAMGAVMRNDAQVVRLVADKRYAGPGEPERTVVEVVALARTVADAEQQAVAA